MIIFNADDYGINIRQAKEILACKDKGCLNSVSLLVNGPEAECITGILPKELRCRLHLNFREGQCLSAPSDIPLLVNENGFFCLSFMGLLILSLIRSKKLKQQLMIETDLQLKRFLKLSGEDRPLRVDSHGHYHMIPVVWDALFETCKKNGVDIEEIRIPAEPFGPFLSHPQSLLHLPVLGIIKNLLMHVLYTINKISGSHPKDFDFQKRAPVFFGMIYTTRMFKATVRKYLPDFLRLAHARNRDLELMFHPGGLKEKDELWDLRFAAFHLSNDRRKEAKTLSFLKNLFKGKNL